MIYKISQSLKKFFLSITIILSINHTHTACDNELQNVMLDVLIKIFDYENSDSVFYKNVCELGERIGKLLIPENTYAMSDIDTAIKVIAEEVKMILSDVKNINFYKKNSCDNPYKGWTNSLNINFSSNVCNNYFCQNDILKTSPFSNSLNAFSTLYYMFYPLIDTQNFEAEEIKLQKKYLDEHMQSILKHRDNGMEKIRKINTLLLLIHEKTWRKYLPSSLYKRYFKYRKNKTFTIAAGALFRYLILSGKVSWKTLMA